MKYYKVLKECFYDGRKFGPIVMIDKAYERPSPQRMSIVRFADDVKPPAVFFEPRTPPVVRNASSSVSSYNCSMVAASQVSPPSIEVPINCPPTTKKEPSEAAVQ